MARKKKSHKKQAHKVSVKNSINIPGQKIDMLMSEAVKAHKNEDFKTAANLYKKVLEIYPKNPDALHLLGLVAYKTGQYENALHLISNAIDLKNDNAGYYFNLGNVFLKMDKLLDACNAFKEAIKLNPEFDIAYGNLASAYLRADRLDDALNAAVAATKLNPDSKESAVYYNIAATVFLHYGEYSAGEECAVKGLQCNPNLPELYKILGDNFSEQGKFKAASEALSLAIKMDPNNLDAKGNYAFSLLGSGNLIEGWNYYKTGYEQGYRTPPDYGFKTWNREDLTNKSIIVLPEQGIGDEILFASCIPDLIELTDKVYINCDDRLSEIYQRSFPSSTIISGRKPEQREKHKENLPSIDYQVACGDLPMFFRTKIDDFPSNGGYLVADQTKTNFWKKKINELGPGLKVGISWRSGKLNVRRSHHYVSLSDWKPILEVPGIQFVNLQYDDCQNVLDDIEEKLGIKIHNFSDVDLKNDLDDVLSIIDSVDLVVSIGNAVYALSSALGADTWKLAMPSWLSLGTDHEPWFPNSKQFIKHMAKEWSPVINEVAVQLQEKVNN